MEKSERTETAQFPAIGLTQAIESIRALWKRAESSEVTPEVAAVTLGYRRLGPQARKRLAAFRAYGLIDEGQGVRLSDLALTIMHQEVQRQRGSREHLEAVRAAALRPKLFREVFRSHGNAPYEALRSHLTTERGLSSMVARTFIAAFRDAVAAGRLREADSSHVENNRPLRASEGAPGLSGDAGTPPGAERHVFRWLLSKSATAELRLFGDNVTAAELDRLREYVELARHALDGDETDHVSKPHRGSSKKTIRRSRARLGNGRHGR